MEGLGRTLPFGRFVDCFGRIVGRVKKRVQHPSHIGKRFHPRVILPRRSPPSKCRNDAQKTIGASVVECLPVTRPLSKARRDGADDVLDTSPCRLHSLPPVPPVFAKVHSVLILNLRVRLSGPLDPPCHLSRSTCSPKLRWTQLRN